MEIAQLIKWKEIITTLDQIYYLAEGVINFYEQPIDGEELLNKIDYVQDKLVKFFYEEKLS